MPAIPPNMECEADDEESRREEQPDLAQANDTHKQTNKVNTTHTKKRLRLDGTILPSNVDISELRGRLANHNPNEANRFSILGVLGELDIENNPPIKSNPVNKETQKSTNDKTSTKSWCPPIFIYNVNIKTLVQQLQSKTPAITFKIKNINKNKSKIYFSDSTVHTEMMALLRTKNIHSYSFTPKELKQDSLILRGLCFDSEPEAIKLELDSMVPDVVATVSKFSTPGSRKKNVETGLFLVSLLPGKKLTDVKHIKGLLHQVICWETPKKKDKEIQCHRCQRWGHTARNCNSAFNCVKCDQEHLPGECLRVRSEDSDPHCVNCGEAGHPANWRGCPTYKRYIKYRSEKIQKAREQRSAVSSNVNKAINMSLISPGTTFANLFQPSFNVNAKHSKKPSIVDDFLKLAKYFMEPEELTLEQEINIFLMEYTNMPKNEAKAEFLRLLNKVKTQYGS